MFPQCYHWLFSGKIVYKDGNEQPFNGLRCFYSGRLYWSRDPDSLKQDYKNSTSIELERVARIDFDGTADDKIRKGTVTLRGGDTLKNIYMYAGECEWAKYEKDKFTCDDKADLQGPWTEPGISAIAISRTPKYSAAPAKK
jgi:hypothetical protein